MSRENISKEKCIEVDVWFGLPFLQVPTQSRETNSWITFPVAVLTGSTSLKCYFHLKGYNFKFRFTYTNLILLLWKPIEIYEVVTHYQLK